MPVLENPHGDGMPCNMYCTEKTHAVLLLGAPYDKAGFITTRASLLQGVTPLFASYGWVPVDAKRVETDASHVLATILASPINEGPVLIPAGSTAQMPLPSDADTYLPWLVTVQVLSEDAID